MLDALLCFRLGGFVAELVVVGDEAFGGTGAGAVSAKRFIMAIGFDRR